MEATAQVPRRPLHHRMPPAVWTALSWAGAVTFPFALFGAVDDGAEHAGVLRYVLPTLALTLPAALLHRRPLLVVALLLTGTSVVVFAVHTRDHAYLTVVRSLQLLAVDVAVGWVAAHRRRRVSATVALLALLTQLLDWFAEPIAGDPTTRAELSIVAMATAWLIGNSVRARRRYSDALRAQAQLQAVTAERLRIARDLHDLVAHSIGIIAIQAGMGSRVIDTQPVEARNALQAIEATSREALGGLRRVVGGLRHAQPDVAPRQPGAEPPGSRRPGSAGADLPAPSPVAPSPVPGLAGVDRLAATAAAAGVRVDVCWRGDPRPVPADIDLSAFRIIQEAVTNVLRHSGTHECRVTVRYGETDLHIEVNDDGHGCPVPGTGYGITGMRERVGLLHGEFSAGPRPDGGFRVVAALPLPESSPPGLPLPERLPEPAGDATAVPVPPR